MKRHEAIKEITDSLRGDELVISSAGMISRELFTIHDSPHNFYMLGSLGLSSSVGAGIALSRPDKRILIIEGDGSILMNLGSLATIGHFSPGNFTQIVLDNEIYESTGGQCTSSSSVKLEDVARASGYRIAERVESKERLREVLTSSWGHGPAFILIKVEIGTMSNIGRVVHYPTEITERFKETVLLV